MKSRSRPGQAASTTINEPKHNALSLEIEPVALSLRLAPSLVELALQREISWGEAALVLDAIEFYSEQEAARWRRTQELIAEYEAAVA
jgi:hypothetical protein